MKTAIRTKTGLKAGGMRLNHNRELVKAKPGVKAGGGKSIF